LQVNAGVGNKNTSMVERNFKKISGGNDASIVIPAQAGIRKYRKAVMRMKIKHTSSESLIEGSEEIINSYRAPHL